MTDFTLAVDRIRRTVVQIVTMEMVRSAIGSGFFVAEIGHVITAAHVVKAHTGHLAIGIPERNDDRARANFSVVQCEAIEQDDAHDLALLRPLLNPFAGQVPALVPGTSCGRA